MIKRIPIAALKQGMYISDLNAEWIPHSNLKKRGVIRSEEVVEKIKQFGITEVYIDTSLGGDTQDAMTSAEVDAENEAALQEAGAMAPIMKPTISLNDELNAAAKVHTEAIGLITNLIGDVRDKKPIKLEAFEDVADGMLDSVLRNHNALTCLGRIREKDSYLMEHSVNLAVLMTVFGKSLKLDKETMQHVAIGAMLHDIGKIMIPDEVLHKPDRLTAKEFDVMKQHASYSRELLEQTEGMPALAVTVAAQHHEKMDGSGYPLGLCGHQISPFGRMAAVVDVYDAITADRVYHKGIPPAGALKKLLEWSNHLDPSLVRHFIRSVGIYPVGSLVLLESGRLAVVIEANDFDQRLPRVKVVYHTKFRTFVKVEELELSKPSCQDRIEKAVDPESYKIRVGDFL
jgi:HD-GYP domain-containing protein (c-di-GMP phosphodiesterase class II)